MFFQADAQFHNSENINAQLFPSLQRLTCTIMTENQNNEPLLEVLKAGKIANYHL